MLLTILAGAGLLASVHLFAGKLRFLDVIPRSRWLSFGSGISVAYVFLRLLPELSEAERPLREALGEGVLSAVEHHVYILAVLGLAAFYGLERMAERSRRQQREAEREDSTSSRIFWLHTISFGIYNVLIGYVLGEEAEQLGPYWLFIVAMALHFLVNDYGLRHHHKKDYRNKGRWVLAGSVVLGAGIGYWVTLPEAVLLVPLAFVAGAVVLNVLKEELPEERQSRFGAFALGLVLYGAILLAV